MSRNVSFVRKIIYGGLIVVLLIPLFGLGRPATYDAQGQLTGGGLLAKMRSEYDLAQANLGEVDPASESMKLATLGMRNVAADILWHKATEYQKKDDWDNLSATLNQITKLQPNFIYVWEFQGHNLSYNVSAQFDDYRHRYHWVKKGIDFLIQGTQYNRREARLFHSVGWFFGQKLGRADEYLLYRNLFRQDRDYHNFLSSYVDIENPVARGRHDQLPDNWLVSRLWYIKAQNIVDTGLRPLRGKSPLVFHSDRPKTYMNYSETIEEEGHFGEVARAAWSDGLKEWNDFGNRQIPSSWGVDIRLNDYSPAQDEVARMQKELLALAPDAPEQIQNERRAALTPEELEILNTPNEQRMDRFTEKQWQTLMAVQGKLLVSDADVASRVPSENQAKAQRLARKLASARIMLERINRYRNQVNFNYWQKRCEAEQTEQATNARELLYLADQDLEDAKLEEARQKFESAWGLWAEILDGYPVLREELADSPSVRRAMELYRVVLGQLGEDPPKDFKLQWLYDETAVQQPRSQDFVPIDQEVPGQDTRPAQPGPPAGSN